MATTPGFSYVHAEESAVNHLLHLQLPDSADLFELTDTCAAYVSVLVETDDAVTFAMLCKQLLAGYGVAGGLCRGVNAGGNGRDIACERSERTHRAAA
ncbi:Uncharacterised protein [Enterobacter hormaechei]|uniref:Uncharacterized protein n=1 Tax=Enterobacter hormaechei TaxID=158836 RepID=A0ABD7KRC6_9ENTR|nr:Uncharacterised protein [Enterobacter hormaechei]